MLSVKKKRNLQQIYVKVIIENKYVHNYGTKEYSSLI